jgi:DNA-binding CsgD family transcriptional regulator
MLVRNITDRKHAEEELKKAYDELEMRVEERTAELAKAVDNLKKNEQLLSAESHRLQETNTALKVLLERREEDKHDLEMKFLANVRNLVLPYVAKLNVTSLTHDQASYVELITTNLNNIISPFLRNLTASYIDFTPREIEIADLVREGKSAKEIALLLNCSTRSIEFHKDNIRRKLGLTGQKTNLRTYLLSLANTSS